MLHSILLVLISFSFCLVSKICFAETQNEKTNDRKLQAYRIDQPPQFDGLVEEPIWLRMEAATAFVQRNPDEGELSKEKTEVRIGFDEKNLYVGIICFDSQPENLVINRNQRDGLKYDSDFIMLLLDTFHDGQNAFIFGTNPTGIEHDAQISKAGQSRGGGGGPARAGGGGTQRGGSSAENLNWDGAIGNLSCREVMVVSRCPIRTEAGKSVLNSSSSLGLWSNKSICEGAPD